jgi:excisionase family DNA binding protein
MSEQPATWQRVTVAEAAEVLGVSTATVRRMVRRGQLDGERVQRPQGMVYVVRLPQDAAAGAQQPSGTRQAPGDTPRGSVQGDDRSQAMATWAASLLAPIAAELGEARQTIERQAGELGDLREERGRLSVGLVEMTVRLVEAKAERDAAESNRRRLARLLSLAVAVLVALLVLALVAPAWVR